MRESKELLDLLKKLLVISKDVTLAEELGITQTALKHWRHDDRVNHQKVIELCIKKGLDLNKLYNDSRDYHRDEMGMTSENEKLVSSTGTGEFFRLDSSLGQLGSIPPYISDDSIWCSPAAKNSSIHDRYWVVPDNRMSPKILKGSRIIVRYDRDGLPDIKKHSIALWAIQRTSDSEEELVLGRVYSEPDSNSIRITADNPSYPEITPYSIKAHFKIMFVISKF